MTWSPDSVGRTIVTSAVAGAHGDADANDTTPVVASSVGRPRRVNDYLALCASNSALSNATSCTSTLWRADNRLNATVS